MVRHGRPGPGHPVERRAVRSRRIPGVDGSGEGSGGDVVDVARDAHRNGLQVCRLPAGPRRELLPEARLGEEAATAFGVGHRDLEQLVVRAVRAEELFADLGV